MKQSTSSATPPPGLHVAVIMDGNGRWAMARGLPRSEGHRAGREALRRVVESAPTLGIGTLTVFGFSSDNWRRPPGEVAALMRNFHEYLRADGARLAAQGVRLTILGRRGGLRLPLRAAIEAAETVTREPTGGRKLHLRIAWNYSGRDAILRAAERLHRRKEISPEEFARCLAGENGARAAAPDVDLLIRTGGELRLSDFMLWEIAYAELFFTPRLWPDFTAGDLEAALREFRNRDRRFGQGAVAAAS